MFLKSLFLKYKSSISNIGIYFLASLIPMAINVLINPLIALNMEPVDYAIVGFYGSFTVLLSPLISFYAHGYYTKRYFELEESERLLLKSTILKSLAFFSMVLAVVSLFALYIYMTFFNKGSEIAFLPYAIISVFTMPLSGIFTLKLVDYKMQKNSKMFFNLSVGKGVLLAGLSILLVVIFKLGALGKLSAVFVSTLAFYIYLIYQDFELYKTKIDWGIFKSMLKFTWPLILGAMMHFFTNGYDRVYLERLGNASELGYYVVAVQIVGYIGIFKSAIGSTFQPDIYKAVVEKNWKTALKYISLTVVSTFVIVLVFIILAPFVIDILTAGKYTYSTKYARILAFSQVTSALYYVTTEITIVLGYTVLSLVNKIIGVILTIGLFYFLITRWGFMGAAWGQVISYILLMIVNIIALLFWINYQNNKVKA